MTRRVYASLPPMLAVTAVLAGCGSSSSSSNSSGSSAATSSTATTPTGSTRTSATPTTPVGASAVADCKRGIRALPHLQQKVTEKLEAICEKAASGDANAKRKAAEEACRELVNASPLPAGEAKERALAACKNAGGAK